jgi:hypothetical protein
MSAKSSPAVDERRRLGRTALISSILATLAFVVPQSQVSTAKSFLACPSDPYVTFLGAGN